MDDLRWLKMAYAAATNSRDPSTQIGAMLVNSEEPEDSKCHVLAANNFPFGINDKLADRWERPLKYSYVEHAERNVIFAAARRGVQTMALTMYATWAACAECSRAIIQAGIYEVVCHTTQAYEQSERWKESVKLGRALLAEGNVPLRIVEGKIGCQIRFDGKMIEV